MMQFLPRYLIELLLEIPITLLTVAGFLAALGSNSVDVGSEFIAALSAAVMFCVIIFYFRIVFGQIATALALRLLLHKKGMSNPRLAVVVNVVTMLGLIVLVDRVVTHGDAALPFPQFYVVGLVTVILSPFSADWVVSAYRRRKSKPSQTPHK